MPPCMPLTQQAPISQQLPCAGPPVWDSALDAWRHFDLRVGREFSLHLRVVTKQGAFTAPVLGKPALNLFAAGPPPRPPLLSEFGSARLRDVVVEGGLDALVSQIHFAPHIIVREVNIDGPLNGELYDRAWQKLMDTQEVWLMGVVGGHCEPSLHLMLLPASLPLTGHPEEEARVLLGWFIPVPAYDLDPVDACLHALRSHRVAQLRSQHLEAQPHEHTAAARAPGVEDRGAPGFRGEDDAGDPQLGPTAAGTPGPRVLAGARTPAGIPAPLGPPLPYGPPATLGIGARGARTQPSHAPAREVDDTAAARSGAPRRLAEGAVDTSGGGQSANGGADAGADVDSAWAREVTAMYERREADAHRQDSRRVLVVVRKVLMCDAPRSHTRGGQELGVQWRFTQERYAAGVSGLPAGCGSVSVGDGVHLAEAWPPFVYTNHLLRKSSGGEQCRVPEPVPPLPQEFLIDCACATSHPNNGCVGRPGREALYQLRLHGVSRALQIRRTRTHGLGVFTRERLEEGCFIAEYTGVVLQPRAASQAECGYHHLGWHYLFNMPRVANAWPGPPAATVDATHVGNVSRFINHGCEPNCVVVSVCQPHEPGDASQLLLVQALREIAPGEELLLIYSEPDPKLTDTSHVPARCRCMCGFESCRGYTFPLRKAVPTFSSDSRPDPGPPRGGRSGNDPVHGTTTGEQGTRGGRGSRGGPGSSQQPSAHGANGVFSLPRILATVGGDGQGPTDECEGVSSPPPCPGGRGAKQPGPRQQAVPVAESAGGCAQRVPAPGRPKRTAASLAAVPDVEDSGQAVDKPTGRAVTSRFKVVRKQGAPARG